MSLQPAEPFAFAYAVEDHYTGLSFSEDASSDGKVISGEYRVLMPDCRTKIVKYTADDYNGFVAEVTYEGEICEYKAPEKPAGGYAYPQPENPLYTR